MNIKNNAKQWIVAGIILVAAILMLMLGFSEKKAPAPAVEKAKPEAALPVKAPEPAAEAEPAVPAEPSAETAPAAEEKAAAPAEAVADETVAPIKEAKPEEASKEVIEVEPENAVLMFTATAEKDFTYEVYYTVEREVWFDADHVVAAEGKAGTENYGIVLPEKAVYRIRLDFGSYPGTVTVKNVRLDGSQKADLNDFNNYEFAQIDKYQKNEDGSLTITSEQEDPYMAFRTELLSE